MKNVRERRKSQPYRTDRAQENNKHAHANDRSRRSSEQVRTSEDRNLHTNDRGRRRSELPTTYQNSRFSFRRDRTREENSRSKNDFGSERREELNSRRTSKDMDRQQKTQPTKKQSQQQQLQRQQQQQQQKQQNIPLKTQTARHPSTKTPPPQPIPAVLVSPVPENEDDSTRVPDYENDSVCAPDDDGDSTRVPDCGDDSTRVSDYENDSTRISCCGDDTTWVPDQEDEPSALHHYNDEFTGVPHYGDESTRVPDHWLGTPTAPAATEHATSPVAAASIPGRRIEKREFNGVAERFTNSRAVVRFGQLSSFASSSAGARNSLLELVSSGGGSGGGGVGGGSERESGVDENTDRQSLRIRDTWKDLSTDGAKKNFGVDDNEKDFGVGDTEKDLSVGDSNFKRSSDVGDIEKSSGNGDIKKDFDAGSSDSVINPNITHKDLDLQKKETFPNQDANTNVFVDGIVQKDNNSGIYNNNNNDDDDDDNSNNNNENADTNDVTRDRESDIKRENSLGQHQHQRHIKFDDSSDTATTTSATTSTTATTATTATATGVVVVGDVDEGEEGKNDSEQCLPLRPKTSAGIRRLGNLVATAAQSQQFFEGLGKMRERVVEQNKDKDPLPVFNKRLFAAHGSVVITAEARRLMAQNARVRPGQDLPLMGKMELQSMRCVVEGLRLIHRGQDHVKEALSHVVTFETYSPYQYIVKRPFETQLSCYYILHGSVQVTYDMDVTETRNVFQPDIIYNHGSGEFLGLVSPDGLSDDLSPPATIYTTEPSEFLRIDRQKFHAVVQKIGDLQRQDKLSFLSKPANALSSLPPEALEKVISHVHKMEYPPNKTILCQNEASDYLFFIVSGRCQLSRDVYISEIERDVCFYLDSREHDDFFAEECILEEGAGSICHVTTTSHTSCFLMHKAALQVVNKEMLQHVLESRRHYFPPDVELQDRGYRKSQWDGYKHHVVSQSLRERGCLYILSRDTPERVRSRPPSAEFQQRENLLRFMARGAHYTPVLRPRVRSASVRASVTSSSAVRFLPTRPRTALDSIHPDLMQPPPPPPPPPLLQPSGTRVSSGSNGGGGGGRSGSSSAASTRAAVPVSDNRSGDGGGGGGGGAEEELERVDGDGRSDDGHTYEEMSPSDDVTGGLPVTSSFVRMLEKNLPKGVLQKIIGTRGSDMDPRLLGRIMEDNPELGRQLRLAWELHQQEKNDGFTKTSVLVTMKTDDIVRKAKALAEKQTLVSHDEEGKEEEEEEDDEVNEESSNRWNSSSLYRENRAARASIAGDKFRAAFLRKKIKGLQTKRAKERAELIYRSAKPGEVPSGSAKVGQGREAKKMIVAPERFYLDEIQSKYQGLDPEAASKKVNCMGYQVLFVSKLRRRCRSMHDIREAANNENQVSSDTSKSSDNFLTPRLDCKQESASVRRRSMESVTSRGRYQESVRKDAPVTLRPLTMSARSEGDIVSVTTTTTFSHRRSSRDATVSGNSTPTRPRLPCPKLQLNR